MPDRFKKPPSATRPNPDDFGGRSPFQEGIAAYLNGAYGPLSDTEVERYVRFWETPVGREVGEAMRKALLSAFGSAGDSTGKAVADVYRRYFPATDPGPAPEGKLTFFEDLGFSFTSPPDQWAFFDVKRFNSAAVIGYMRSKPQVVFMLVVEQIPPDTITSEAAAAAVRASLESRVDSYRFVSEEPMSLNGLDGVLLVSEARILSKEANYLHWVCSHRDHVYQLVTWALKSDADFTTLRREALSVETGFAVLDRGAEPSPAVETPLLSDYRSERYGYGVRLTGSRWTRWDSIAKDAPAADFGGLQEESGFVVIPVHFGPSSKLDPSPENLAKGLLQRLEIEWSSIATDAVRPIEENRRRGYLIDFERDVNERHYVYRMKVWKGAEVGYLVAVWTRAQDRSVLDDLLARFHFDPDLAWAKEWKLDESEKTSQAMTLNDIGIEYYRHGQYGMSAGYFDAAVDGKPSDAAMLSNLMSALTHTGRFEEALRKLDERTPAFPDDLRLQSYRPYLLEKLDKRDQAVELYRALFAKGYQNDDDLIDYAELLWEMERKDDALDAVKSYRESRDSLTAARYEAALYRRLEQHDCAIALLEERHRAFPNDQDVTLDLVESYYVAAKYGESRDSRTKPRLQR